jgi:hypothetical protein
MAEILYEQTCDLADQYTSLKNDPDPRVRDAVHNASLSEAALIPLIGPEETLALLLAHRAQEGGLPRLVNQRYVTPSIAAIMHGRGMPHATPLLSRFYGLFLHKFKHKSNELLPLVTVVNALLLASQGRQTSWPGQKVLTEAVLLSSKENKMRLGHNMGVLVTYQTYMKWQKSEEALHAIPEDMALYLQQALGLNAPFICPTAQIRRLMGKIKARGDVGDAMFDRVGKRYFVYVLQIPNDNVNFERTTELENTVVMENVISVLLVVKRHWMSYNDFVSIIGECGTKRGTLFPNREQQIAAMEAFARDRDDRASMENILFAQVCMHAWIYVCANMWCHIFYA